MIEQWEREWDLWREYQAGMDSLHAEWAADQQPKGCGYVYAINLRPTNDPFLYAPDELFKIGRSVDPVKRLAAIQKSEVRMPYQMELRHTWWAEDASATERLLHTILHPYRVDGEWFRVPHELTHVFEDIWYFHGSPGPPEGIVANDNFGHWSAGVIDFFQHHLDEFERMHQRREARTS